MKPFHLRALCGVSLNGLAERLGMTPADLRAIEAIPTLAWSFVDLEEYARALGLVLEVVAVAPDGARTPIDNDGAAIPDAAQPRIRAKRKLRGAP